MHYIRVLKGPKLVREEARENASRRNKGTWRLTARVTVHTDLDDATLAADVRLYGFLLSRGKVLAQGETEWRSHMHALDLVLPGIQDLSLRQCAKEDLEVLISYFPTAPESLLLLSVSRVPEVVSAWAKPAWENLSSPSLPSSYEEKEHGLKDLQDFSERRLLDPSGLEIRIFEDRRPSIARHIW